MRAPIRRAAAQANNELHQRIHAGCARPRNSSASSRTLVKARPARNCAVPARIGLQLHQQGRRVGPSLGHPPTHGTAVLFAAMPLSGLLHSQSRFEAGPHLLRSADTLELSQLQLERLGTDATRPPPHLEPPGLVDHAQVQVLNKNVGANSPTCFTADSCRCNFRKPSAPENSCHNTFDFSHSIPKVISEKQKGMIVSNRQPSTKLVSQ